MTAEEIVVAALARCSEFGLPVPNTRSVSYRRIDRRTQQLMVRVAEIDPEYHGTSEDVALAAGVADLTGLATPAERVHHVTIADAGTSALAVGTKVNIVPADDLASALAPRALLRDYQLVAVGTDLDGVAALTVHYAKRPATVSAATDEPELPDHFHELLVVDLALQLTRKALGAPEELRGSVLELLKAEEDELLGDLARHVERFASLRAARWRA